MWENFTASPQRIQQESQQPFPVPKNLQIVGTLMRWSFSNECQSRGKPREPSGHSPFTITCKWATDGIPSLFALQLLVARLPVQSKDQNTSSVKYSEFLTTISVHFFQKFNVIDTHFDTCLVYLILTNHVRCNEVGAVCSSHFHSAGFPFANSDWIVDCRYFRMDTVHHLRSNRSIQLFHLFLHFNSFTGWHLGSPCWIW